MKRFIFHPPRETPQERFLRIQVHAAPYQRSVWSRPLLMGLGLLLLLGCLLLLGLLKGIRQARSGFVLSHTLCAPLHGVRSCDVERAESAKEVSGISKLFLTRAIGSPFAFA
jgi:hypothetical protein